jgi:hypothetical protein
VGAGGYLGEREAAALQLGHIRRPAALVVIIRGPYRPLVEYQAFQFTW